MGEFFTDGNDPRHQATTARYWFETHSGQFVQRSQFMQKILYSQHLRNYGWLWRKKGSIFLQRTSNDLLILYYSELLLKMRTGSMFGGIS
ncbi:hypothetical protein TNCV_495201 [Trichonephila clavipes]|nr:hypothetical protein TNCV_495201 [Trichonephila clavipes]